MTDAERQRKHRERLQQERGPHLSDHQKLAQARAEIARLRKAAEAKAELLIDATRRKLEGELMKVKLENDRLREQLAAKVAPASSGEIALLRQASQGAEGGDCRRPLRQGEDAQEGAKEGTQEDAQEDARLTLLHRRPRRLDLDLRRLAAARPSRSPSPPAARIMLSLFASRRAAADLFDAVVP